jgi:lipase chaperone LimK
MVKYLQHTTKLGQFKRSSQSREGSNIYALWSAKDNTVAVLVRLRSRIAHVLFADNAMLT